MEKCEEGNHFPRFQGFSEQRVLFNYERHQKRYFSINLCCWPKFPELEAGRCSSHNFYYWTTAGTDLGSNSRRRALVVLGSTESHASVLNHPTAPSRPDTNSLEPDNNERNYSVSQDGWYSGCGMCGNNWSFVAKHLSTAKLHLRHIYKF